MYTESARLLRDSRNQKTSEKIANELQCVLERQVRQLACGVLGHPQRSALDSSTEADVRVRWAVTNACSHSREVGCLYADIGRPASLHGGQ